ncbi:HYR domain-containing protein [Archangium gephyra]|uniref:HYR domain-containing protein n=1 Tax=Archangium gephyra TaxID=48 RepID=A0AAC8Q8F6_9BACT|nr:HYR domain-containing protein [Archangium gephyra]AKJ02973.1 Hyalin [Archangium gephyra]REG25098.1 HYR domain-containing protein [Archangium gephyra]
MRQACSKREHPIPAALLRLVISLYSGLLVAGLPDTALAAIVSDPNCSKQILPPDEIHDDNFVGTSLGFPLVLGGSTVHEEVFVDVNGYVSFGIPPLVENSIHGRERMEDPKYSTIAAFYADIDPRNPDAGDVTYGQTTYAGHRAFCVNWGGEKGVGSSPWWYRPNLRNKIQLILVHREDRGPHDFDIIMNYDQVQWDESYSYYRTASTRPTWVGFTGLPQAVPGSGIPPPSVLVDGKPHALTAGSVGSPVLGRYIFEIRNGRSPQVAVVSGTLYTPDNQPIAGAMVQLCRADGKCATAPTNAEGRYSMRILEQIVDGTPFSLSANPPMNQELLLPIRNVREVTPIVGSVLDGYDAVLRAAEPMPVGTGLEPLVGLTAAKTPVVYWKDPLHISTHGCPEATVATYTVYEGPGNTGSVLSTGPMIWDEKTAKYEATIPPLYPAHGLATIEMRLVCKNGVELIDSFPIYIDPSGYVRNAKGNPIRGAKVTLYRSDYAQGPFELVPDGSAIMSPANRTNPMYSDERGYFGWDTLAGYYVVRAEKPGCTAVGRTDRAYTETGVLPVPPPVTDLDLRLDCGAVPPPALSVPSHLAVEAQTSAGAVVTYEASALDAADGSVPVKCLPSSGSSFPFGTTAVTCTAMNSYGNGATASFSVTVADTQPPVLTLPNDMAAYATSAAGASVTYEANAVDALDGVVAPLCIPPSGATFPPGESKALCTASDSHGNASHGSFSVLITYEFGGLLPPLSGSSRSTFKKNQVLPVRFTLTGSSAGISTLAARLFVAKVVEDGVRPEVPAVSAGGGTTDNLFRPTGSTGSYQFLLSTKSMDPGVYWLRIDLGDAVIHAVPVTLTN